MKVLYYYYYLFYKKVLKDDTPHMLTIMALSVCQAFFITAIIEFLIIKLYCYELGEWGMPFVVLLFIIFNYFFYEKSHKNIEIIKEEPKFFNNNIISVSGSRSKWHFWCI